MGDDITPDPAALRVRDGVEARETVHEVDADTFGSARDRIAAGLDWGVGGVVTDERGRLLLVREDGRWLAPGGGVEAGESHEAALVREIREETGVTVTVDRLVAVTDVTFTHEDRRTGFHFAHYTATPESTATTDDPGLDDEAIEAVAWKARLPTDTVDRDVLERFR